MFSNRFDTIDFRLLIISKMTKNCNDGCSIFQNVVAKKLHSTKILYMFLVLQKTDCNTTRVNIKIVIAGQTIDTHQRRIHEKSRWIQGKYFKITQRSSLYVNRINQIFWKWHCFLMNENEFCFCGMLHSNINNKCLNVMLSHTFALVLNVVW